MVINKEWLAVYVTDAKGTEIRVYGSFLAGPEKIMYFLEKSETIPINPRVLMLEISPQPTSGQTNTCYVGFTEKVSDESVYTDVQIQFRNDVISLKLNK